MDDATIITILHILVVVAVAVVVVVVSGSYPSEGERKQYVEIGKIVQIFSTALTNITIMRFSATKYSLSYFVRNLQ